ncbi:MAG: response regulator [Bdellovibrionota bacterium]|nr:response regulator [Bdellovibrionota bacterium]
MEKHTDFTGLRVIAVEDNVVCAKVIERFLEKMGCQFQIFEDPENALRCLKEKPFDLAIIDLNNPGMAGTLVADKFQQESSGLNMIATTAFVESYSREECLNHGFKELLLKPLTADTLAKGMEKALEPPQLFPEEELREIMAYFDDDVEFMEKNFQIMKKKIGSKTQDLENAINDKDYQKIAFASHSIKNSLMYFGKSKALTAIKEIEEASRKSEDINFHYPLNSFKQNISEIEEKVVAIRKAIHDEKTNYPSIKLMSQYKTSA